MTHYSNPYPGRKCSRTSRFPALPQDQARAITVAPPYRCEGVRVFGFHVARLPAGNKMAGLTGNKVAGLKWLISPPFIGATFLPFHQMWGAKGAASPLLVTPLPFPVKYLVKKASGGSPATGKRP